MLLVFLHTLYGRIHRHGRNLPMPLPRFSAFRGTSRALQSVFWSCGSLFKTQLRIVVDVSDDFATHAKESIKLVDIILSISLYHPSAFTPPDHKIRSFFFSGIKQANIAIKNLHTVFVFQAGVLANCFRNNFVAYKFVRKSPIRHFVSYNVMLCFYRFFFVVFRKSIRCFAFACVTSMYPLFCILFFPAKNNFTHLLVPPVLQIDSDCTQSPYASRRFPATEKGWQGNPPEITSTVRSPVRS